MKEMFDKNILILKISGMWVPSKNEAPLKKWSVMIYNSFCILYSIILFTIAEFMSLPDSSKSINDLVKNLNMSMSFLLTFFKVAVWMYRRSAILNIMTTLSTTDIFSPINNYKPDDIFSHEKKINDRLTYTFFGFAFMVPTSACLLSFYNVLAVSAEKGPTNTSKIDDCHKLPYHSFIPFDYTSSSFAFCAAVTYQCLALLICGTITVGFDMLYMSIVTMTSAHLKSLQGAFSNIRGICVNKLKLSNMNALLSNDGLDEEMLKEQVRYIKHLQIILRICKMLETLFSNLILLQILISLLVFCTCLYLVSSLPIGVVGNELAYLIAIEIQLAFYCYAGTKLTYRGEGIPFSLYSCDWISASKRFKDNMILTMMRMGQPIFLTAGKFTPINLATFVTIGRGSYSLLAVLKQR